MVLAGLIKFCFRKIAGFSYKHVYAVDIPKLLRFCYSTF